MAYKLKNLNAGFPPGGFPFLDPRTGYKRPGYEGTPTMQAVKIIEHRKSNPHVYPASEKHWFETEAVIQEILEQKFRTHPQLFVGHEGAVNPQPRAQKQSAVVLSPTTKCAGCGNDTFEPIFCKTCGGKKITGYKCAKCGKER